MRTAGVLQQLTSLLQPLTQRFNKCVVAGGKCLLGMMTPHLTQRFFGHIGERKIKRFSRANGVARRERS